MAQQNEFEYFDSVNKFASENQSNKTKQQTAVEWLWNEIDNLIPYQDINKAQQFNGLLEQAKAMEKEQIINAFDDGDFMSCGSEKDAINYYNETYNK
jgi:hypothetical protein